MACMQKPSLSTVLMVFQILLAIFCLIEERYAFPALARMHKYNQLKKVLLKEISNLKVPIRTRRFVEDPGPFAEGTNLRKSFASNVHSYNLDRFILENSYVNKPTYGGLADPGYSHEKDQPQLRPFVEQNSKSSNWMFERSLKSPCTNSQFIAGPSNSRFMCWDHINPKIESRGIIESMIPGKVLIDHPRRMRAEIRSLLQGRRQHAPLMTTET